MYRQWHNTALEKLHGATADGGGRHKLLEHIAQRWEAYDESAEPRWRAAGTLIGTLGVWRGEINDEERYQTFAPVPGMVADLIEALDDVEYEEYRPDASGVAKRQARETSAKAQALADAVKAWEAAL